MSEGCEPEEELPKANLKRAARGAAKSTAEPAPKDERPCCGSKRGATALEEPGVAKKRGRSSGESEAAAELPTAKAKSKAPKNQPVRASKRGAVAANPRAARAARRKGGACGIS